MFSEGLLTAVTLFPATKKGARGWGVGVTFIGCLTSHLLPHAGGEVTAADSSRGPVDAGS